MVIVCFISLVFKINNTYRYIATNEEEDLKTVGLLLLLFFITSYNIADRQVGNRQIVVLYDISIGVCYYIGTSSPLFTRRYCRPPVCACTLRRRRENMYCCRRRPIAALRRSCQSRAGRPSENIFFPLLLFSIRHACLRGRLRKTAPLYVFRCTTMYTIIDYYYKINLNVQVIGSKHLYLNNGAQNTYTSTEQNNKMFSLLFCLIITQIYTRHKFRYFYIMYIVYTYTNILNHIIILYIIHFFNIDIIVSVFLQVLIDNSFL